MSFNIHVCFAVQVMYAWAAELYIHTAHQAFFFVITPPVSLFCRFEYLFNFDSMFEIHDDIEVLKRMGMAFGLESGKCPPEDLKVARSLVPKALEPYVIGRFAIFLRK